MLACTPFHLCYYFFQVLFISVSFVLSLDWHPALLASPIHLCSGVMHVNLFSSFFSLSKNYVLWKMPSIWNCCVRFNSIGSKFLQLITLSIIDASLSDDRVWLSSKVIIVRNEYEKINRGGWIILFNFFSGPVHVHCQQAIGAATNGCEAQNKGLYEK